VRARTCRACRKPFPGRQRLFCGDCYSAAEDEAMAEDGPAYVDEDAYRSEVARILRRREDEMNAASCSCCGELACDCPQGDPPETPAEMAGVRGFL